MQVPLNACCIGGPPVEQPAFSAGALLVLAAIYGAGALVVFAVLAINLS
jgi:hypothetical protein